MIDMGHHNMVICSRIDPVQESPCSGGEITVPIIHSDYPKETNNHCSTTNWLIIWLPFGAVIVPQSSNGLVLSDIKRQSNHF